MSEKAFQYPQYCTGCSACVNICPKDCLKLVYRSDGFRYPVFSSDSACVHCGLCEKVCPVRYLDSNHSVDSKQPIRSFMYQCEDLAIREKSSSGGAYSRLADAVLKQNGIVFGCAFNPHTKEIEYDDSDHQNYENFRKSKYVEANPRDVFRRVRKNLLANRYVLFCGTPCHVEGLVRFLGKLADSKYLLTVDFRCHGVPSNAHFSEYLSTLENSKCPIQKIDFRYKDFKSGQYMWRADSFLGIISEKGRRKIFHYNESEYYRSFCDSMFLRESCYFCKRIENSKADISIGDFWRLQKYAPNKNDKMGTSLLCVQTKRGDSFITPLVNKEEFELLPYSAVEYWFHGNDYRKEYTLLSNLYNRISQIGYLKTMKEIYGNSCKLNHFKRIIKNILCIED